jgi:hypothetical protein
MEKDILRKQVDNLFQVYCDLAKKMFHSEEGVVPIIILFKMVGDQLSPSDAVLITEDKDAVAELVQTLCRKINAAAGVLISKSWVTSMVIDGMYDGTPPSKRLDREEVLQVVLFPKVVHKMMVWRIVKKEGEKKYLEPEPVNESSDPGQAYSRFLGNYFRVDA